MPALFASAVVPPGYYFDGTTTTKCAAGSYRADWKTTTQATSCISCGEGVKAATTDQIKQYNITDATITEMVQVTTSSDDCCKCCTRGRLRTSPCSDVNSCVGCSKLLIASGVLSEAVCAACISDAGSYPHCKPLSWLLCRDLHVLTLCCCHRCLYSLSADIQAGQGLYFSSTTATWRARNCSSNNYGVANLTYGLTPAPCRVCAARPLCYTSCPVPSLQLSAAAS